MSEPQQPPSVGVMLGAAGPCPEVEHGGRAWKVGHPTERARVELERLAVQVASRSIYELEAALPPQEFKKASETFVRAVSAKRYKTWGEGWQEIVFSPENLHLFLLSLLRQNHPDATEDLAQELISACRLQVSVALAQVLPDFIKLLLRAHKMLTPEQRERFAGEFVERATAALAPQPQPQPQPQPPTPGSPSS